MYLTSDPAQDYQRYTEECEEAFEKENASMVCAGCGEPIGRKKHYCFTDGYGSENWCPRCAKKAVRDLYIDDVDLEGLTDQEDIDEAIQAYLDDHEVFEW